MGLTIYGSFLTQDTEKFPLSILTSVRIKKVNFRENIGTDSFVFVSKKSYIWVSVESGSTVFFFVFISLMSAFPCCNDK